jgi:hypothetical protein
MNPPSVSAPIPHNEVRIQSFDPLTIAMPRQDVFVGDVTLRMPALHVKLYDLSLGGALPGAHIGSDIEIFVWHMQLGEPGLTAAKMLTFIHAAQDEFKQGWQIMQDELDKRGALL